MDDAYVIGIRLALDNGVSEGVAAIRGELSSLDRAVAASAMRLADLRRAAVATLSPVAAISAPQVAAAKRRSAAELERAEAPSTLAPIAQEQATPPAAVNVRLVPFAGLPPVPLDAGPPAEAAPIAVAEVAQKTSIRSRQPETAPVQPTPTLSIAAPRVAQKTAVFDDRPPAPGKAPAQERALAPSLATVFAPVRDLRTVARQCAGPVGYSEPKPTAVHAAGGGQPLGLMRDARPPTVGVVATPVQPVSQPISARLAALAVAPAEPGGLGSPMMPMVRTSAPVAPSPRQNAATGAPSAVAPALPSAVPPPDNDVSARLAGDVYLDGAKVGRWIAERMERDAARPPVGPTFFDPRQSPTWAGATVGM